MTIKLRKSNLKRLASLSALGAGALGVNAGTAEAYVVYSGIVDQKVGFGPGYGTHASIALPNGAALTFRTWQYTVPVTGGSLHAHYVAISNHGAPNGTRASFRYIRNPWDDYSAIALAAPQGARFGTSPPNVRFYGWIAASRTSNDEIQSFKFTKFNATDRYLLFRFAGGKLPYPIYGWAQFSVTLPGHAAGPQATLISWAYETSGAQLPAGVHGKKPDGSDDISAIAPSGSHAPMPSAPDSTGLPALALGATGVRRWRAARRSA